MKLINLLLEETKKVKTSDLTLQFLKDLGVEELRIPSPNEDSTSVISTKGGEGVEKVGFKKYKKVNYDFFPSQIQALETWKRIVIKKYGDVEITINTETGQAEVLSNEFNQDRERYSKAKADYYASSGESLDENEEQSLADKINSAVPKDSNIEDFAKAVGSFLKNSYGSNNIEPFMSALHKSLGIE